MAKIRTIQLKVFGKFEDFVINYAAKQSKFTVKLPERLEKYFEETDKDRYDFNSDTENGLTDKIRELIKKFEGQKVVQRKVIAYEIKWSSENVECNVADYRGMHDCSDSASIEFKYKVLIEKSVDEVKKYYEEHEWHGEAELCETNDREKDWSFIEWTQEREAFMKNFYTSLENLMTSLNNVIGTPERLLTTAAGSLHLLADQRATKEVVK